MNGRNSPPWSLIVLWGLIALLGATPSARGEVFTLKSGIKVEGAGGQLAALNAGPMNIPPPTKNILLVDDNLRQVFFGWNQLAGTPAPGAVPFRAITVDQPVARAGKQIFAVGNPLRITPFDDHGRRTFTMVGPEGKPIDVVQGITHVTPTYTKLEGLQLKSGSQTYIWSTRIATSSIPREQLSRILHKAVGPKDSDKRLQIVKLYMQADRVQDARIELEGVIKDFPELAALKENVDSLRQQGATVLFREIELRRQSGQPLLAIAMLDGFPQEGVAGELLIKRKDMLDEFTAQHEQGKKVLALLKEHQAALDPKAAAEVKPICDEIAAELNIHTLDRMADYLRLSDDAMTTADQKLSLAISGWLLGSGSGTDNLSVSKSLVEVRRLVRAYLNSKTLGDRKAILAQLKEQEGSSPQQVSKIIAHMKPPYEEGAALVAEEIDLGDIGAILGPAKDGKGKAGARSVPAVPDARAPKGKVEPAAPRETRRPSAGERAIFAALAQKPAADTKEPEAEPPPLDLGEPATDPAEPAKPAGIPGFLALSCKGPAEHPLIKYYVQLPPEYSPYRRYGVIVTLNGAGTTPQQQIDWWAGSFNEQLQMRPGQASRHGYIVVAPVWQKEYQRKYEYSLREHACVLNSLRDVFRRFSVDTDKVFLSGHSMGGDAAWDIGLAHPDLWAGVMPIVATSDKYVRLYWENAALLPMYFVCGERDGNRWAVNAVDWDRYLTRSTVNQWDIMVVRYHGRGHESYHDDIQNLFAWMNLHQRNFFPRDFKVKSMRPWDNFYWYVEAADYLATNMVHPVDWTGERPPRANPALVEGRILPAPSNGVRANSSARKVTVWLSPEMVNFDARVTVNINNKDMKGPFQPNLEDLLEDVRTRGDRVHPFWLKVTN
ncbi:MAG TPA: alpha/beta hydrolase-fold protein [Pirellulaceae bacterium]|nr:alpha/beta hydrolase-fold protein [Pirellulaceae bacterium]